jgi:hypothetical protein
MVHKGFVEKARHIDSANWKIRRATKCDSAHADPFSSSMGRVPHLNNPGGIFMMIVTQQAAFFVAFVQ